MTPPTEIRVADQSDREAFNAFVSAAPSGDLLQSWEWGEIKRSSGWAPRRYLAEQEGATVASASILRTRPFKGAPAILYAPRGPVFAKTDAVAPLVAAITKDAGSAFMLKADPAIESGSPQELALRNAGFRDAGSGGFGGVQPKAVMVLDLTRSPEEIHAGFKPKWKYNIRLAERKGVVVEESDDGAMGAFYELLVETAKRDGFYVRGRSYFDGLYAELAPRKMLSLWLAKYEGRAIAGAICFAFGSRVTYVYGASSNTDRNVMPNHLMQWTMIRHAKEHGAAIYDFRGVSPKRGDSPAEDRLAGLNRFKEGFGARYLEYAGDLDLPLRPLAYKAWTRAAPPAIRLYKKLKGGKSATVGTPD